jgi:uncharacterized protein with PIN domain
MTPEELEVHLRAEAERHIKAMMETYRNSARKSLNEIEQAALALGQQIKEAALRGMVEARPEDSIPPACPECGGRLSAKGQRRKWVVTQAGEVQVSRAYYYCETCGKGFFPQ